jgi:hypothetical protein
VGLAAITEHTVAVSVPEGERRISEQQGIAQARSCFADGMMTLAACSGAIPQPTLAGYTTCGWRAGQAASRRCNLSRSQLAINIGCTYPATQPVIMHVPLEQATLATLGRELGAGQACPHAPQLSTLVRRLMQVLPPQFSQQTPAKHFWPVSGRGAQT